MLSYIIFIYSSLVLMHSFNSVLILIHIHFSKIIVKKRYDLDMEIPRIELGPFDTVFEARILWKSQRWITRHKNIHVNQTAICSNPHVFVENLASTMYFIHLICIYYFMFCAQSNNLILFYQKKKERKRNEISVPFVWELSERYFKLNSAWHYHLNIFN